MKTSDEEFSRLVAEALATIPESFQPYLQEIAVDIEDMPGPKVCADMDIDDPTSLMGLYQGTPLPDRHVDAPFRYPERVVIYKGNIERACRTRRQIIEQVRKTVLHEIGHHFGLDEDELEDLGYA